MGITVVPFDDLSHSSGLDIGKARSNHVFRMNLCLHSGEIESVVIA